MSNLKLKVCGMRDPENIKELVELRPDFIGFIFYKKSPRYDTHLNEDVVSRIPISIKKVGVFVNESLDSIMNLVDKYGLDYVQLHGDEDLDFAKQLKAEGIKIIKVFRILESIPVVALKYQGIADYILFDTATSGYGGSGRHFDWNILKNYNLEIPFLLSGGIDLMDMEKIKSMAIPQMSGIDVNSRFEIEPGLKDLKKVKELKALL